MLRIHTTNSPEGVKQYFAASDYYAEGAETVGRWGGKLADRLGLHGMVDQAGFERLCDNLDPRTGQRLTLRTNGERRVGNDMVYSGPKSFGVLTMLAPEEEKQALLKLLCDSAERTQRIMEADMRTRVRKGGMDADRDTGNACWASFLHTTSRPVDGQPPDPHPHVHAFTFNATLDPEERRIKAAQFGDIVRDRPYYEAMFFSFLADGLVERDYAIDRRGGGKWEVAGIPQAIIDKFSKRTGEIEDEARRLNITDPGRKAGLGAKTRAKKDKELTPDELRRAWDAQLTDGERDALAAVYTRQTAASPEVTPERAVTFALNHCFEKESLVPERELVRVALLHGLGSLGEEEVRREMDRLGVLTGELDGRRMGTTRQVQREEAYIVTWASQGVSTVPPLGVPVGLARGTLDDEQWQAVRGLLSTSDRVSMVDSAAGTGKSTMLAAYDRGMKLAGEHVTYLGTTASAVKVLTKDGLKADTVARFLKDEKMQNAAQGGRIVVDEASMLGHRDAYRLFRLADERDLSLVFLGDQRQHSSVSRGALMRILQAYGHVQPFRLTKIKRQQDAAYLAAVKELSEGNPTAGFDQLAANGWVVELGDGDDRCRRMAADYVQAIGEGKSCLVVSPTHAEAGRITQAIRDQLRQAGKLGEKETAFTRLVAVDASEAEKGLATTYRPGDVIQFHQNAKGFTKGQRLTVTDPAAVPLEHAEKFSLYRPEAVNMAAGDIIRFTGTVATRDGEHKLRNGDVHTVAEITSGGNLRLNNGWVVDKDAGHFRSGFVETSMGSQGRTVQRVILGMSSASLPAINMETMYVSASRAREQVRLYTDDADAVRDAIRRSSAKKAALDLVPPVPAARDRQREYEEHRKRWAFFERQRAAWEAPRPPGRGEGRPNTYAGHLTLRQGGREDDRGR